MTPIEPRWYCVSALGVATLCADEQDARNEARSNDVQWDRHAPHRAVLLGDVAAERETIQRLRELLRRVADEPNIDKARAWADAELYPAADGKAAP